MPSGCSEPRGRFLITRPCRPVLPMGKRRWPWLRRLITVPLPLLLTVLSAELVRAENPWLRGQFPVAGFLSYTSHYGFRQGPSGEAESHRGLDIAAPLGSPVRSWWGGRIVEVILDQGCGVGLVVRSGAWEHLYCHLAGSVQNGIYRADGVQIAVGQSVRLGQMIGRVGVSGRTTGPHLHWGLRYDGRWLDPALILRAMAEARRPMAPNVRPEPRVGLSR